MTTRLQGHFDGSRIVLDQPAPPELLVGTPVEVVLPDTPLILIDKSERERILKEWIASVKELWERPLPPDFKPQAASGSAKIVMRNATSAVLAEQSCP